MNAAPGAAYEAVFEAAQTGLVGTVALALLDNQGVVTEPFDTSGIIELQVGGNPTGIYSATRTAPTVGGQYTLLWSRDGTTDPEQTASEELVVTGSAPAFVPPTGVAYATLEEFQAKVQIRVPTDIQTAAMNRVLNIASLEIDNETQRVDALAAWEYLLCTEVCLERAFEHWEAAGNPFGIMAMGDAQMVYTSRDSWDRHAHKLAPLKQQWGVA